MSSPRSPLDGAGVAGVSFTGGSTSSSSSSLLLLRISSFPATISAIMRSSASNGSAGIFSRMSYSAKHTRSCSSSNSSSRLYLHHLLLLSYCLFCRSLELRLELHHAAVGAEVAHRRVTHGQVVLGRDKLAALVTYYSLEIQIWDSNDRYLTMCNPQQTYEDIINSFRLFIRSISTFCSTFYLLWFYRWLLIGKTKMSGFLDNCHLPDCECLQLGDRRNLVASVISGVLFFSGWWIAIDAAVQYPSQSDLHHACHTCGAIGTLAFFLINSVSNGQIRGDNYVRYCSNLGEQKICGSKICAFVNSC
ncbi:TM50B-like protein [Mya arenaria]|uniref:TM50B-like protein n=1 Tax=Mya arenaria TaxID=6604 RepID=A0ABY7EIQ3_MYAAR|nr:TM50B-like protein [Mya arenaria]